MIKDTIGNIFDFVSETNLTEQDFYENKGNYPVYSGQTENEGIVAKTNFYKQNKPCITFTTYGSAGKLSYRKGKFTIGRNCMGLRVKKKYSKDIIVEWFAFKFQNLFYRLRIGDPQGQKSLNKLLIQDIKIVIPDKKIQEKQLSYYKKAMEILKKVNSMKDELSSLLNSKQSFKVKYKDKLNNMLNIVGGNSGLTEEFIYYNQPTKNEESIRIFSGATADNNFLGFVNKNSKPNGAKLKIFKSPFVQIIRKGLAGSMVYYKKGEFTANDDIYISTIKEGWKNKINLRWFAYQYQELFYNLITSKSDNATFNKDYAKRQVIKLPDKKIQDKIAEKLLKIDSLIREFNRIENKLKEFIEYEIK